MEVTQPRLLHAAKTLGIALAPTPQPRIWAANINDTLVQVLILPSQVLLRADIAGAGIPECNNVNASPLLVKAALLTEPSATTRLEYGFPTAAGLSDEQLQRVLKVGLDHLFLAKKQLLEPSP